MIAIFIVLSMLLGDLSFIYHPEGQWLECPCVGRSNNVWIKLGENGLLMPLGITTDELSLYIEGLRGVE